MDEAATGCHAEVAAKGRKYEMSGNGLAEAEAIQLRAVDEVEGSPAAPAGQR